VRGFRSLTTIYLTAVETRPLPRQRLDNDAAMQRPQPRANFRFVIVIAVSRISYASELSMGPFCVTRSNPTRQLTEPTQPNPTHYKCGNLDPTQYNCCPLIYYTLSLLTKLLVLLQPTKKNEKSRANPTQSNPTHGQLTLRRHRPRRKCPLT